MLSLIRMLGSKERILATSLTGALSKSIELILSHGKIAHVNLIQQVSTQDFSHVTLAN